MSERPKLSLGGGALSLGGGLSLGGSKRGKAATSRPVTGAATEVETKSHEELAELSKAFFKQHATDRDRRFELILDGTFWLGVVFATTEDLNTFLEALGGDLDVHENFVDGYELARKLGVKIDPPKLPMLRPPISEAFAEFALQPGESPAAPGGLDTANLPAAPAAGGKAHKAAALSLGSRKRR